MSSTYRDAPGWVRMMRDPARLVHEVHDHRGGECILPAEFKDAEDCGYDGAGCYYERPLPQKLPTEPPATCYPC
jgi:hypothetical protein